MHVKGGGEIDRGGGSGKGGRKRKKMIIKTPYGPKTIQRNVKEEGVAWGLPQACQGKPSGDALEKGGKTRGGVKGEFPAEKGSVPCPVQGFRKIWKQRVGGGRTWGRGFGTTSLSEE